MAKKVNFPLDMGNDIKARSIEELKANYNAEKVTEYFLNGKLLTWLEDRYYDEEAEQIRELSEQSHNNPAAKLAKIFGVEINESVDVETLEIRRKKLEKLREITSEDEILDNVDRVAFSQEELGDLLDDEVEVIYLCGESFRIPLSVKNVRYVGVNNPAVTISGKGEIDLEANGIILERCELPKEIEKKTNSTQIDSEYKIKLCVPKQTPTAKNNNVVLAAEYADEILYIYFRKYSTGDEVLNHKIFVSHKKSGESFMNVTIGTAIRTATAKYLELQEVLAGKKALYNKREPISKTTVYAKGNSAFEIYKIQMLEALDNLPKEFEKKDGIVDITDSETIAAIEEAVGLFIEYNNLKAEKSIQYLEDEEEPYD